MVLHTLHVLCPPSPLSPRLLTMHTLLLSSLSPSLSLLSLAPPRSSLRLLAPLSPSALPSLSPRASLGLLRVESLPLRLPRVPQPLVPRKLQLDPHLLQLLPLHLLPFHQALDARLLLLWCPLCLRGLLCSSLPVDFAEGLVGALEKFRVNLVSGDEGAGDSAVSDEHLVVGLRHDRRDLGVLELYEGVVLALACLFIPGEPEPAHDAELREVLAHLLLEEAVRHAAQVHHAALCLVGRAYGGGFRGRLDFFELG
mmetsp:Transcript_59921/g.141288  ORF Transcript_59921/g.141288 Transcript_59921/m.141288 type:complete len:255 (+) Transcript_59921:160-924(+)